MVHHSNRHRFAGVVAILAAALLHAVRAADQPASDGNRVVNAGFEQGIQGWKWRLSKADATGEIVTDCAHSGRAAFRISNRTPYKWYLYGSLEQTLTGLKPDTEYELSVWVKSASARSCSIGAGKSHDAVQALPLNSTAWQRVAVRFKTEPGATTLPIHIKANGLTDELLIDDVAVTETAEPHAWVYEPTVRPAVESAKAGLFTLSRGAYDPASYDVTEDVSGTVTFAVPANDAGGRVTILSRAGSGQESGLGSTQLSAVPAPSVVSVPFCFSARRFVPGDTFLVVRRDGVADPVATVGIKRRDLVDLLPGLVKETSARLARLRSETEERKLADNRYVQLGLNIAARYLARVQDPNIQSRQEQYWSWLQLWETAHVLTATEGLLRTPMADPPAIPSKQPRIDQGVLVSDGPVFYGGFDGAADRDFPNLPGLGASVIEIEMGPNALAADGSDPGRQIDRLLKRFTLAQAANIKILLLLSPHYFPKWALESAPDVAASNKGSFIKFNVDHPVARKAVEQWLKSVIPAVKEQPALLDVCLSNEPEYFISGHDSYSKPLWIDYLKKRHGSVEVLNGLYGTTHASFDVVPVPASRPAASDPIGKRRAYYDWGRFNDRHFAEWHRWMNGLIKQAAPNVPTHAKIMAVRALDADSIGSGIDPEEFCGITDLAGCDDYCSVPDYSEVGGWADGGATGPASALYAYGWQTEEMTYDLLRSFRNQPVVNSENHFIPDRHKLPVPADYVRSVMWQGALHGQAATALWIFRDAGKDPTSDACGSIYYRPADLFGAGRAWLDARRCASQVAAVVRATPHIAILYSRNSLYWCEDCIGSVAAAYTALTFLGEPVRFVTEKQLEEGTAAPVQAILLPQANHVTDATVLALTKFAAKGGKLIALGDGNLGFDEYDRARNVPSTLKVMQIPASSDERVLFRQLAPIARSLGAPSELMDARTGERVFGIEYRVVSDQGRVYLSALNQLKDEQVVILAGGTQAPIKDLLSGGLVDGARIRLVPMTPVLLDLGVPMKAH